jgi:hypothetical protein
VSNAWQVSRRSTRLLRLQVRGAPAGATAEVGCLVHRCRLRAQSATADARGFASLTGLFRRRTLRRGTVLEVRITAPDLIGKVVRYRVRRGHIPKGRVLCLPPQASGPQRC